MVEGNCWAEMARILKKRFPAKNRTGKQCRERYLNFLQFDDPEAPSKVWSTEEMKVLFEKFSELGSRWA